MSQFSIERAEKYILENISKVNQIYKPELHFSAQTGWINDPNGCVFFRGEYHLFYQFNPYDSVWGPMHWGHAKSKDLLHWEHLPVALVPDQDYDKDGCFSGSAIVKDDILWLMYTGHIVDEDGSVRQIQNMAYSEDGISFHKIKENPVATGEVLPEEFVKSDFRDPKLFEKDERYYSVVAAKHQDGVGCIILLGSDDLVSWQFESIFLKGEPHQGFMWECPDYFEIDGKSYLMMSPMRYQRVGNDFVNLNSSVLVSGFVDWDKKQFYQETVKEIDHGHNYYAPQSFEDNKGNRIVIAWMQNWGRTAVTHNLKHGWAGAMTTPRILKYKGEKILQTLPDGILEQLTLLSVEGNSQVGYLQSDWTAGKVYRLGTSEDYLEFGYDAVAKEVYVDRSHLKIQIKGEEEWPINRRVVSVEAHEVLFILDKSLLEIFINNGEESLSSSYYLTDSGILQELTN